MAGFEDDEQPQGPFWSGNGPDDEDSDRLTIGQRIAGARDPLPQAPAEAPVPQVRAPLDPAAIPNFVRPPAPDQIPTPPTGRNNPNLSDLAKQQAEYGKPLDPQAVDPESGKPKYKLGTGGRILRALTGFAEGGPGGVLRSFSDQSSPNYAGPGATNWKFGRDEALRQGKLADVNAQIGTQEKLDTENQKGYEDAVKSAYETQLGEAQRQKADVAAQLADIKSQATNNQFEEAKGKLEQMAKKAESDANLRQQLIDNQRAMADLRAQIAQGQLDQKQRELESKYGAGATEKALEDERKERLQAIENDWKEHPYWNKLTGNKNKEIQAVNDDINSRLQRIAPSRTPASNNPASQTAPGPPRPQTHSWSRGAWQRANPKGDVKAAEKAARAQRFEITD